MHDIPLSGMTVEACLMVRGVPARRTQIYSNDCCPTQTGTYKELRTMFRGSGTETVKPHTDSRFKGIRSCLIEISIPRDLSPSPC